MSEILTLSRAFFLNAVREKLFIGLLIGTLLLLGFADYLSSLALAEPYRVFSGFGSIAVWIVGILVIITFCIFDYKKGFENRSAQVILARPISRWKYAFAAFLSQAALLWLYSIGAFGVLWVWFRFSFGSWAVPVLYACVVTALALTLLAGLALLCSSLFETSILSLIGFVSLLLVCLLNEPALTLAQRYSTSPVSKWTNLAITYVLPTLSHYRPAEIMAHNLTPPLAELAWLALYTGFFCAASLLLGAMVFNAKDLP
jgi:ABC-type transport system involved in multi-copper enzyme maturation permease subunit